MEAETTSCLKANAHPLEVKKIIGISERLPVKAIKRNAIPKLKTPRSGLVSTNLNVLLRNATQSLVGPLPSKDSNLNDHCGCRTRAEKALDVKGANRQSKCAYTRRVQELASICLNDVAP